MNLFFEKLLSTPIAPCPSDWVTIAYLAITGLLIVIFRKNLAQWYIYVCAHVALILGVLSLGFIPQPLPLLFQVLRDWYPIATIPTFYWEVAPLTQIIFQSDFDDKMLQWEDRLFKGQPSLYLSKRFPSIVLSEFLHLCYFSYYWIIFSLAAMLYLQGKYQEFHEVVFAIVLTFNICQIWHILMPVKGPRYGFEKIKENLAVGFFHNLTHAVLSRASSKGTAFPSSHAAIAVIVLLCAVRYDFISFIILCPFCIGLVVGTVYGRFHYAIDAIAGTALAFITFEIAPIVYRLLM